LALAVVSPSMAADLKGDLLAMEKSIWKAWASHDVKAYADHVTADAVMAAGGSVSTDREKMIEAVGSHTCTLKAIDFTDTNIRQPTPDVAILTYTATRDITCDGKKEPPKAFVTAIYVEQDGKWRWTNYQETVLK